MHLFRSEEHARRWTGYAPESGDGTKPIADIAAFFAIPVFRERLAPDYLLRLDELRQDMPGALARIGKGSPFWAAGPPS